MDTSVALNPNDLFLASGLVIILTDGGSGIVLFTAEFLIRNGHG